VLRACDDAPRIVRRAWPVRLAEAPYPASVKDSDRTKGFLIHICGLLGFKVY